MEGNLNNTLLKFYEENDILCWCDDVEDTEQMLAVLLIELVSVVKRRRNIILRQMALYGIDSVVSRRRRFEGSSVVPSVWELHFEFKLRARVVSGVFEFGRCRDSSSGDVYSFYDFHDSGEIMKMKSARSRV
jgi:hypothetical protein